jgi:hypothetical protein
VTGPDGASDPHPTPSTPSTPTPAPAAEASPGSTKAGAAGRRVDPEDWSAAPSDDDERYERERPPHWE